MKKAGKNAALDWIRAQDRTNLCTQIILTRILAQECECWQTVKALDLASKALTGDLKMYARKDKTAIRAEQLGGRGR